MEKDFDRWNEIKKATDAADEGARLYFREGEVWWVRLGHNVGYEANGKSREFTRPVVVLKKVQPILIPCASAHYSAEAQSLSSPRRHGRRQAGIRDTFAAAQHR